MLLLVLWAGGINNLYSFGKVTDAPDVVIAAVPRFFPPQYAVDDSGHPVGFAIDILQAAARYAGISVEYRIYDSWPEVHQAMLDGEVHIIPNMGITNERAQFANFTSPVETFPVSIFVRAEDSDLRSVDDLSGVHIGVVEKNVAVKLLDDSGFSYLVFKDFSDALLELLSGRLDALAYPEPVVWHKSREIGLDHRIRALKPPLIEVKRAIAVRKDLPELLLRLENAVTALVHSDSYEKIYVKWYARPVPYWSGVRMLGLTLLLTVGLSSGFILWRFYSLRTINVQLRNESMLRGRAEEKLKQLNVQLESEVKIRTAELAESQRIGRMGHWVLDLAKDDLTWSDEIFRIFEIDPDRFGASYKAFLETIHPDDREAVDSAYTKSLYDKQPYDITHRLLFPDGRVKWVHEKCETKFDEKGIPLISRGTVQDITANKFVERKLSLTQYAMDHVSEAAFLLDKDGRFSYVNHSACTSFGYSRDELLAMSLGDVTHSLSPVSLPDRLASLKDTGTQRFETVYLRRDGQRLQVEIVADFLVFDDDEYVFAVARDISAIKEAQAEIERQHNLLQAVVDGVSDPIMMIDSDYNVGLMNRAARHTAPEFALALSQPKCYQVSHHANEPCTGNEHPCPLRDVFETGKTHRVEHEHPVGNHVEKIYQILANPMLDSEGEVIGVIESYRDVSEYRNLLEKLRENESRLAHIAHHDNLTGLPNRLLFVDRLQQAIIKARRSQSLIALMFLDLDRFKEVNDSYGHQVGDKLLSLASTRLRRHIREEDTAARIGGDEFTIILDSIDKAQDAGTVAEKLLLAFQQPFEIDDKTFFLTTSIGISIYPQDGTDANTLIRNADSAMYNAKEYGRNLFRYYREEMTATAMERVVMETSLRGALEQEAFELYYQPQIDMRSGELVGLEALVRWNHPQQGLLAPSKFIPMAEETGLILPIGEWILHQACQQARIWLDRGLNRSRISVNCNLSGRQIESEVFHHTVLKIIEETGIEPDLLELEITESSLMDDPQSSSRMLDKLCDIGVRLAIDDFGTGYSSLAYLKALPISTLKIDQSFVRDIMADTDDAAITRAVIALGSSLRMQVIAEGVETEEQAEFLLREGCHIGQGFLFARPMPALEFENYLLAMTEEYK